MLKASISTIKDNWNAHLQAIPGFAIPVFLRLYCSITLFNSLSLNIHETDEALKGDSLAQNTETSKPSA